MKEEHYFYVTNVEDTTELPQSEAVHALRVLRLKEGDVTFLMDGRGYFYRARVTTATAKHCVCKIEEKQEQHKEWKGGIHLAVAPTKNMDRMEWLAEKATEIGIDTIGFLDCKFSERHLLRTDRIEKIVVSAMKQSRKAWKPIVHELMKINDFLSEKHKGKVFICHCYEEIERVDLFTELQKGEPTDDVTIMIGPEGDFSLDEVKKAIESGCISATLGTSRLRTETAALSAVMMANIIHRK